MREDDLLRWLHMMPWACADDLEQVLQVSRANINRTLAHLYNDGMAVSRMVGRRRRPTRRWISTSAGLAHEYAVDHDATAHVLYGHTHSPFFPDLADHRHVPWWLGEAGIRELYQRMESVEAVYEVAPRLFHGLGRHWLRGGAEAQFQGVRFLRRGQLVEMFATYEGDIDVAFCWIGRQVTPRRMMGKWSDRFSNPRLMCTSQAADFEADRLFGLALDGSDERSPNVRESDPHFDPAPHVSGYVVIGHDEWATLQAMDKLPRRSHLRDHAFSWWVADENRLQHLGLYGMVQPVEDSVLDHFEEIRVGLPERVAMPTGKQDRDDPPAPAVLSGVLANRLLGVAENWPACREEDFVDLCPDFRVPIREALADLVAEGLLVQVEDVYYLADGGMKYAAGRDRTSISAGRGRGESYLNPDMVRHHHQLEHNRGVLRVVRRLKQHGIPAYGGWRGSSMFMGSPRFSLTESCMPMEIWVEVSTASSSNVQR